MEEAKRTITKEMTIAEALQISYRCLQVFIKHGMGCAVCMGATAESIEEGALMHGLDVETLVKDLNKACESKEEKE